MPGSRTLFSLDFAGESLGDFPKSLKLLKGNIEIVAKDGQRMLRASDPAEFLINFKEVLPPDFTLEFDIIPKRCGNPEDISFEGTPAMSRSATSMNVVWHRETLVAVGGGVYTQIPVPQDLQETLPQQPTEVRVSMNGGDFKLFTNDRMLLSLGDRKFARGRVLRVFLEGQEGKDFAVYLSRLRVATNSPPPPPKP